jgi:tetratricopeptide (TPR) repeat protein
MSNQKFLTAWLAITLGMFLPVASQQVPKENSPQHHSAKNASDQAATPQASDSSRGAGETSQSEYDRVVQQGRAQLLAGNAQSALTSGAGAINIDASRWEAYALAGGALMNLKRYEDAADNFSRAIDRAPADKQPALRDLRRQCFLAHSGPPPGNTSATQASSPTQAEVVLWKTIENSENSSDYQAYLNQYPSGAFAVLANTRLRQLASKPAPSASETLLNSRWTGLRQWEKDNGTVTAVGKFEISLDDNGNCSATDDGDFRTCTWSFNDNQLQISMPFLHGLCAVEMSGTIESGDKIKGIFQQPRKAHLSGGCGKTHGEWRVVRRPS